MILGCEKESEKIFFQTLQRNSISCNEIMPKTAIPLQSPKGMAITKSTIRVYWLSGPR